MPKRSNPKKRTSRPKPTIHDVARKAGVSKSLVSMAIRGQDNVSSQSREAVLAAAAELNYRPNAMARSLVQQRTRMLGVMISDLRNPFFGDVVSGIQEQAATLGYRVLFNTGDRRQDLEEAAVESLLELRVDGLILAGPMLELGSIERVAGSVPVVVLNRPTVDDATDSVTTDDRSGAEIAVDHCASLGHRRIAHIDGGAGAGSEERRDGYTRAMGRLGLGEHLCIVEGGFTEAAGYRGAQRLLEKKPLPTAVFAANDLSAVGALNALEEAGLTIPGDISLVGYDNTSLASLRHLSLTTIHQPSVEIGRMAVDRLFERVAQHRTEPRHEVVAPSLVVRKTTAPPPEQSS